MKPEIIFTVDLEDWFTDGRQITMNSWNAYELRLEATVHRLLELLALYRCKATFFALGWIARKRPRLIRLIHEMGHEIASHGYAHELVYTLSPSQFRQDVRASKRVLEDIIGDRIWGYRAPCFSITDWGLRILEEEEFHYDSSIVPSTCHDLYSRLYTSVKHPVFNVTERLWELSLPVLGIGRAKLPWGGGGFFRLYPYSLYQYGIQTWLSSGKPFVFYIHPYDLDPGQPRQSHLFGLNRFRRYYGLQTAEYKLERLLKQFSGRSILESYPFLQHQNKPKREFPYGFNQSSMPNSAR